MTCKTTLRLVIGTALLLSGGAAAQAREANFAASPRVVAPRVAHVAPFRDDRAIGPGHSAFHRDEARDDRRFLDRRRDQRPANRLAAPFWGFWPEAWPDEVVAPIAPDVSAAGQPTDTGVASEDSRQPPVSASGSDRTVIRHDFPEYTVFDYCKAQPRQLKDCGPEWIVMHPVGAASPTPPAAVVR